MKDQETSVQYWYDLESWAMSSCLAVFLLSKRLSRKSFHSNSDQVEIPISDFQTGGKDGMYIFR